MDRDGPGTGGRLRQLGDVGGAWAGLGAAGCSALHSSSISWHTANGIRVVLMLFPNVTSTQTRI